LHKLNAFTQQQVGGKIIQPSGKSSEILRASKEGLLRWKPITQHLKIMQKIFLTHCSKSEIINS